MNANENSSNTDISFIVHQMICHHYFLLHSHSSELKISGLIVYTQWITTIMQCYAFFSHETYTRDQSLNDAAY